LGDRGVLTEDQIQGYIDDRLNERDRAAIAAYLLAHPEVAAEIETLRRQNEALRAVGHEVLDEPVPERLRSILREQKVVGLDDVRRRRASPFLEAAAAILLFCAGGAVGWFVNSQVNPASDPADRLASHLAGVFAFYGAAHDYPIDFPPDRSAELAAWIGRSFEREIPPPELTEFGYEYGGGRLLAAAGGNTGFFQFYGPENARLAVFFWRAERPPESIVDLGRQENVSARYWFGDGLGFAVMSDEANPDLEAASKTIFSFYEARFASD
jgi:anti-sigma factor RsiW